MSDEQFAVVGHLTPTDAEEGDEPGVEGRIDEYVRVQLFDSRGEAEQVRDLWFYDGIVVTVEAPSG